MTLYGKHNKMELDEKFIYHERENRNRVSYSEYEKEWIKSNIGVLTYSEMAKILKRNSDAICRKIGYWGFSKPCATNTYKIYEDYAELIVEGSNGILTCIIDLEDVDKLKNHTWNLQNSGYLSARMTINNKSKINHIHRFILDITDANICVDHYDFNKMNNKKSNLRICTKAENNQHREHVWKLNTTGYRGVCHYKDRYVAQVKHNNIVYRLKESYNKEELAQIASFARAYILPFSKDAQDIKQEDIPEWIKIKIDKKRGFNE